MSKSKWAKFWKSSVGKGSKEALRWAVLAFVSIVVKELLIFIPSLNLGPSFYLVSLVILRFADAVLHKTGIAERGITRF